MDFNKTMEKIAESIGAQFNEYDERKSVIVVLLKGSRYQTVMGVLKNHEKYNREVIHLSTKVCDTEQYIHYPDILSQNADFVHSKFVIVDGYLRVEAASFTDSLTEETLKEMVIEVAELGDEWELKITGQDIH